MTDLRLPSLLAALLALTPAGVAAHPHIFIEGGVDFLFDDSGRIDRLRVTWIYDPLNSLFMLEDLGIDADVELPLQPDDRARLAAYQTDWIEGFDGDSYLYHGDARIALSGPQEVEAELRDGQVVIAFVRAIETPLRPDDTTVVEIYDPTYFTAYSVTATPRLEGASEGCRAEVIPFQPAPEIIALQRRLLTVPIDADPEGDPGALFAERVRITCD